MTRMDEKWTEAVITNRPIMNLFLYIYTHIENNKSEASSRLENVPNVTAIHTHIFPLVCIFCYSFYSFLCVTDYSTVKINTKMNAENRCRNSIIIVIAYLLRNIQ